MQPPRGVVEGLPDLRGRRVRDHAQDVVVVLGDVDVGAARARRGAEGGGGAEGAGGGGGEAEAVGVTRGRRGQSPEVPRQHGERGAGYSVPVYFLGSAAKCQVL